VRKEHQERTSQEEGLAPACPIQVAGGQAPLPDLLFLTQLSEVRSAAAVIFHRMIQSCTVVDLIQVRWPSGAVDTLLT